MMRSFLFLFIGIFFFFPLERSSAAEKIFTGIYERVGATLDEKASEVVGGMIGTDPNLVNALVFSKKFTTTENDTTLLEVCRTANDGKISEGEGILSKYDENECVHKIQKLWRQERKNVEKTAIDFEQAVIFSRWWDGVLDGKDDFDILADIEKMEKQFFGSNEGEMFVPRPSLGNQKIFSLLDSGYRLPMDELPFESVGACGNGETSLYGGIVCVPDVCNDFACIRIKAIPGRKASETKCGNEASMKNIFCELENIALLLRDAGDITPTKNSNRAFYNPQIFDGFQNIKSLLTFEHRVPPIISEFAAKKEKTQDTTTPPSKTPSSTETTPGKKLTGEQKEQQNRIGEFTREFERVRGKEVFNVCKENPSSCSSSDVLDSLLFDCSTELSTLPSGNEFVTIEKCLDEQNKNLKTAIDNDWQEKQKAITQTKIEFYNNIPVDLQTLWSSITSFENTLQGLSKCRIEAAKMQCESKEPKKQCEDYTIK